MFTQLKMLPDIISLFQFWEQKWRTEKYSTIFIFIFSSFTVPRLVDMLHLLKTFISFPIIACTT